MIDKLADSEQFKAKLSPEQVKNVALFVSKISPELAMKAWEALTRANGEAIASMWGVEIDDNKTFGNYIAEIVGKPKENKDD